MTHPVRVSHYWQIAIVRSVLIVFCWFTGLGLSRLSADDFQPRRVLPAQPPIVNAPVIAGKAVRTEVAPNELVLGVVIDGQARAYPINMLTGPRREIINDTLGGRAIAATW